MHLRELLSGELFISIMNDIRFVSGVTDQNSRRKCVISHEYGVYLYG
jgi:hypothetical protein